MPFPARHDPLDRGLNVLKLEILKNQHESIDLEINVNHCRLRERIEQEWQHLGRIDLLLLRHHRD